MASRSDAEPAEATRVVAAGSAELAVTTVGIKDYDGDFVLVSYRGLPGNRPKDYSNSIYIWDASVIPWGTAPYGKSSVTTNAESGDQTLRVLISPTTYVVGYATGASQWDACASVLLDAGGSVAPASSVNIGLRALGTSSVTVRYSVLSGYRPAKAGNWVGLWKGRVSPFNCGTPMGTAPVADATEGTVEITGVTIAIKTTYTVVYFMGNSGTTKNNSTAAAILTFDTAAPGSPEATSVRSWKHIREGVQPSPPSRSIRTL